METFFKHMATPGAEVDWRTFDVEKDAAKLDSIAALLNATDPDLSPFRARGGRILMYYGWADPALNPMMGLEYYERVVQTMGPQTPEFYRLFMMPGVFHCSGGVGPDRVDTITPLVAWVEKHAAPDRLVATQKVGDTSAVARGRCASTRRLPSIAARAVPTRPRASLARRRNHDGMPRIRRDFAEGISPQITPITQILFWVNSYRFLAGAGRRHCNPVTLKSSGEAGKLALALRRAPCAKDSVA